MRFDHQIERAFRRFETILRQEAGDVARRHGGEAGHTVDGGSGDQRFRRHQLARRYQKDLRAQSSFIAAILQRTDKRNAAADISATSGYPNATIRSSCFCASSDAFDMSTSVRERVLFPAPSAHCECPNRRKRTFRRTDQHTDSRNGLTARFHRIEQRVWPPTKSFGAGWSTSSVNQSNLQSNSVM